MGGVLISRHKCNKGKRGWVAGSFLAIYARKYKIHSGATTMSSHSLGVCFLSHSDRRQDGIAAGGLKGVRAHPSLPDGEAPILPSSSKEQS